MSMSLGTRCQERRRIAQHPRELTRLKLTTELQPQSLDEEAQISKRRIRKRPLKSPRTVVPGYLRGEAEPSTKDFGLPSQAQYNRVEAEYIDSLSNRKQAKALLSQEIFDHIWDVLLDPIASKVRSPQFRFWVRKMFTLSYIPAPVSDLQDMELTAEVEADIRPVVLHDNLPVAVKDQIYGVLCYCHQVAEHGGRDRTAAVVRKHYSWIPKDLIARFVRVCPTCQFKKTGQVELEALEHPESCAEDDIDMQDDPTSEDCSAGRMMHQSLLLAQGYPPDAKFMLPVRSSYSPGATISPALDASVPSLSTCTSHFPNPVPSGWLSSLTTQPGPNHSNTVYMRRAGSANDAYYPCHTGLPPLMKAFSEGTLGREPPMMRPLTGVAYQFGHHPLSAFHQEHIQDYRSMLPVPKNVMLDIDPSLLHNDEGSDFKAIPEYHLHTASLSPARLPCSNGDEYVVHPAPSGTLAMAMAMSSRKEKEEAVDSDIAGGSLPSN